MSSHHIVKDDQEPALIIANGQACSVSLLHELLEWSPYVVVLDQAIHRVMELGIKIDALLGDFDNDIDYNQVKTLQYPIEIIHTPNPEKTDLEKAFEFLISKGHKAVNVVWATGKRMDHTFHNMTCFTAYTDALKIVFFDDYSKFFRVPKVYEKWYPKDTIISIFPIETVFGITTTNLAYPLKNESLQLGIRSGSSNHVLNDGVVKITYEEGILVLFECWD